MDVYYVIGYIKAFLPKSLSPQGFLADQRVSVLVLRAKAFSIYAVAYCILADFLHEIR